MSGETKWTTSGKDEIKGPDAAVFVFEDAAEPGDRLVAACYGPSRKRRAALIASAPDLYEALENLLHASEHAADRSQYEPAARTALARARGYTP